MITFDDFARDWRDEPDAHEQVLLAFDRLAKSEPAVAEHRRWCVENSIGFGHDSFHGVWLLLAKTLPDGFRFLEIGIHRGQSLSAIDLTASVCGKRCGVVGVGPLDGAGGYYEVRDYEPDVRELFRRFNGDRQPTLIRGLSEDPAAKTAAANLGPYDAVYIDGCHSLTAVRHDYDFYATLVRRGGYLLADDSSNGLNLPPHFFAGFPSSSAVLDARLPPKTPNADWSHVTNVMHLRIWKRL